MNIKIIPTGGLCNRIRAIVTGIAVAKKYGGTPVVYWNNSQGLKADFEDLFMPLEPDYCQIVENKRWLYNINGTKDYLLRYPLLKLYFSQVIFNFSIYRENKDIFCLLKNGCSNDVLLISCYPMCRNYEIRDIFRPREDIQNKINEVTSEFSKNTIGVHIRRTDNTQSINSSPVKAFESILEKEIEKDKDVKFYLASDDNDVKKHFTETFPERIITLWDDTSRNSLEGMKFAVVDLFCLSNTKKIIGSVASSYSQVASEIGNIDIEYAQ